jgi:hypothetical protein
MSSVLFPWRVAAANIMRTLVAVVMVVECRVGDCSGYSA